MKKTNQINYVNLLHLNSYWIAMLVVFLIFSPRLSAQEHKTNERTVTTTQDVFPLTEVNVIVQGNVIGSVTIFDGKYIMEASPSDILAFSYIGFKTKTVAVENNATIYLVLEEALEENVVISYGTHKNPDITGSFCLVNPEEMDKQINKEKTQLINRMELKVLKKHES